MRQTEIPMPPESADLSALMRDTLRESARSWRLPAAIALGLLFGLIERLATGQAISLVFGVVAAVYTLLLGPLPWRALVPLEADGNRAEKFRRWMLAASISLGMFALLVLPYVGLAHALDLSSAQVISHPREISVSTLLFLVGGWGLARDVQLEQRLDRSMRTHGQLTAELEEAKLYALRADLDPHFLFNALNAIASQCTSDPRRAEENVVRLSSLLRSVLDTRRQPLHSLDDELSLAQDYLGLLSARFPALRVRIEVDDAARGISVPPLILQPLLENAVRHGEIDRGEIVVLARAEQDGSLRLEVRSPGDFRGGREGGMGLELVRRRAALAWGERAMFDIGSSETTGTTVARVRAPGPHGATRSAA